MQDLNERFAKHEDEYIKFDRVTAPAHPRPDICAFLRLHELCPGTRDIVSCAGHDEIWLDVDVEEFNEKASDDDILMLTRCGVRYDEDVDSLAMFV